MYINANMTTSGPTRNQFQSVRYTNSTPSEAYNTMSAQQESVRRVDEHYLIENILENSAMTDSLTIRNINIDKKPKRRPHFFISFDTLRDRAYQDEQTQKADTSFQNRSFVAQPSIFKNMGPTEFR